MPNLRDPDQLEAAWASYLEEHPDTRIRDAADTLHVSEAELLATRCGGDVVRLEGRWIDLIAEFETLGPLLALTRNDGAVHEKTGYYHNVSFDEGHNMGMVLGKAVDLRLFMGRWHLGFAVRKETRGRRLHGFQFFDHDGTAVHKTYLRDESDFERYKTLVDSYRAPDQSRAQPVAPCPPPEPETPDDDVDATGLLKTWRTLQDTHDFVRLLKKYGVSRVQALRLGAPEFSRQVAPESARAVLRSVAEREIPIMVFVRNAGCIQIHSGPVHRLKPTGEWFNVLDPGFNLHLREPVVETAWIVRKPTKHGTITSLELYDRLRRPVASFFGERKRGTPEPDSWREIVEELPAAVARSS